MRRPLLFALPLLLTVACAHAPKLVTAATPAQKSLGFGQLEKLAGTWETTDEAGKSAVASVFALTANGSAVREIMFPGTPHEMTNVYHLDGETLRMTHYCASGNQPHLRAVAQAPGRVDFAFDAVTNFTQEDGTYMGELALVLKDTDTLEEHWTHFVRGERKPELVLVLKRQKPAAAQ